MLAIFSSKNVKQGQKLELTFVCFLNYHADEAHDLQNNMKMEWQRRTKMPLPIGEVCNPVCCHGNKTLYPLKGLHDRALALPEGANRGFTVCPKKALKVFPNSLIFENSLISHSHHPYLLATRCLLPTFVLG